jgi:hypothetical protein
MTALPEPPAVPCGSCPYRRDVPSGIWAAEEYVKLVEYDGDIPDQLMSKGAFRLFFCHHDDGHLCGGWLACHGPENLLALRMHEVAPSAYDYASDVPVFTSGAEAAHHGVQDIEDPSDDAHRERCAALKN